MNLRKFAALAKQAVAAWIDDYAPSMGAAISYYTVFSMGPLLLIVIAVAGWVWGREAVQGEIVLQLQSLLGEDAAKGIQGILKAAQEPTQGVVATIVGFLVLAFGATTVFAELQSAMDRIWEVPAAQKKSGIVATIRARLLSFGVVLGLGFLLLVSLVVSAAVAAIGSWAGHMLPAVGEVLLQVLNIAVSLSLMTVLFAMLYKLMPQAKVAWRDVWVGAAVTAVLFEIGKVLIGLYLGKSSISSSYAAAGSIVVLLVWVYYAAQIFLLGAEFTWVYATNHGSRKTAATTAPQALDVKTSMAPADQRADAAKVPLVRPSDAIASVAENAVQQRHLTLAQRALIVGMAAGLQLLVFKMLGSRRTTRRVNVAQTARKVPAG